MARDVEITPPIDTKPGDVNHGHLGRLRSELERDLVEAGSLAVKTLKGVMRSRKATASAKVSAAKAVLEQGVGRPNVRPDAQVIAGTTINVQILSFGGAPTVELPVPLQLPVETQAPESDE